MKVYIKQCWFNKFYYADTSIRISHRWYKNEIGSGFVKRLIEKECA